MSAAAQHVAQVERTIIVAARSENPHEAQGALRDAKRLAAIYAGHAALPHHGTAAREFWQQTADRMAGIAAAIEFYVREINA